MERNELFSRLNAMYTLVTIDGFNILVQAHGIFREGSEGGLSQDQVEYFTHVKLEAPGDSPYAVVLRRRPQCHSAVEAPRVIQKSQ